MHRIAACMAARARRAARAADINIDKVARASEG
jgi:hypothetical protein